MLNVTVYNSRTCTGHVRKGTIQSAALLISHQNFNVQWATYCFRVTRVCESEKKKSVTFFKRDQQKCVKLTAKISGTRLTADLNIGKHCAACCHAKRFAHWTTRTKWTADPVSCFLQTDTASYPWRLHFYQQNYENLQSLCVYSCLKQSIIEEGENFQFFIVFMNLLIYGT
jgi:hypothetical protein